MDKILIGIFVFAVGAVLFSFLNVVIEKLSKNTRPRYLLVEFLGGAAAVVLNRYYGFNLQALTVFLFLGVLTVITFIDMDTQEIPPVLNVCIFLIGVMSIWTVGGVSMTDRVIGMLAVSAPLCVFAWFGGFGGGDVKLMFAAGFLLGWKATVAAFFIGVIVGGAYGIYLLIKRLKGMKDEVAFGPFLCLGLAIAVFFGEEIMEAYISLLGF
ncbi:MAG: A24 family peptidase [Alistipes sp.]|nr:A24 family peptidase [Alistipes sp.]